MRFSLLFVIYIVVGILVAAGIVGGEGNYFSHLNSLEQVLNMVLAVFLWPFVLLGVNFHIGITTDGSMGRGAAGRK